MYYIYTNNRFYFSECPHRCSMSVNHSPEEGFRIRFIPYILHLNQYSENHEIIYFVFNFYFAEDLFIKK